MKEDKKIINQSNINELEVMQKIDNLYAKSELGKLMALYIKDTVSKGNGIFEEVFNYLFEMNFISREYLQGVCSFIEDMVTVDWIMLIDTISKTKESEEIVNFIKELYSAFKNNVDIKMVDEWITLADSPYTFHVMVEEYIGLNIIKKEYDNMMASINDVLDKLQQKEEAIQDITNKLQQKEKERGELEKQLTESEKRRRYYETSYEDTCKKLDTVRDENGKLKLELSTAKISKEIDNKKHEENINSSEIQIYSSIEEKHKEILLKIESINEAVVCMSDNTSHLLKERFDEILSSMTKQLKEQLSNNYSNISVNQQITDKEEQKNSADENINKDVQLIDNEIFSLFEEEQPVNEVDIREENDFYEVPPEYMEEDVVQDFEQKEAQNNEEDDLPGDKESTNAKNLLQTGVQSHEINKAIKNIEESIPFFLRFKKKIDINKKVKFFNKVEDDIKKRQMILEEAMANNFDKNIIKGLKELSGMDTVSLEFLYQMACDKNTSMADMLKLVEYTTA